MNETVTLRFRAIGQSLKSEQECPVYASRTFNYAFAKFELGSGWEDFDSVRAVWQSKHQKVESLLDGDYKCVIPAEVLSTVSPVAVNLVGSTESGGVLIDRLTTFPILAFMVHTHALIYGTETPEITPSMYEQFINDAREQVITEVEAETLEAGFPATASYTRGVLSLGLPKGDPGETGVTPNITIGTVNTVAPDMPANAYLSGTQENPVLNMDIPKGDPGELVFAENGLLIDEDGMFYAIIND